jgi:hypothetical protein
MPRACTVCLHEDRPAIDRALVEGVPFRDIARRWATLSKDSVARHREAHVSPALTVVRARREAAGAETLADRVESLYGRASAILERAEDGGRDHVALGALRELRGIVELLARLTGELDSRPSTVVNIIGSADWWQLRDRLLAALPDDPNQRAAVVRRLRELDS